MCDDSIYKIRRLYHIFLKVARKKAYDIDKSDVLDREVEEELVKFIYRNC